jgi:hypothetical protein
MRSPIVLLDFGAVHIYTLLLIATNTFAQDYAKDYACSALAKYLGLSLPLLQMQIPEANGSSAACSPVFSFPSRSSSIDHQADL